MGIGSNDYSTLWKKDGRKTEGKSSVGGSTEAWWWVAVVLRR